MMSGKGEQVPERSQEFSSLRALWESITEGSSQPPSTRHGGTEQMTHRPYATAQAEQKTKGAVQQSPIEVKANLSLFKDRTPVSSTGKRQGTCSEGTKAKPKVAYDWGHAREKVSWKLSTSPAFPKMSPLQRAVIADGIKTVGTKEFSSNIKRKLKAKKFVDSSCDVSINIVRPIRDMTRRIIVTSKGITEIEKVDVLVNVIGQDLDMMQTSVGQAILDCTSLDCTKEDAEEFFEEQLLANFEHASNAKSMVIRTDAPKRGVLSSVSCILHAVMDKFTKEHSPKVKEVVTNCLSQTADAKKKTIVFPPVGMGYRFEYPEGDVAKDMVCATLDFLKRNRSIQVVVFSTNDPDVASTFDREVKKQTAASLGEPSSRGDVAVDISVTKENTSKHIKEFLNTFVYGAFQFEIEVCNVDECDELDTSQAAEINFFADKNGVRLQEKRNAEGRLRLSVIGKEENCGIVANIIRGQFFQEIEKGMPLSFPTYWQMSQTYTSIQNAIADLERREQKFELVDVDSTERMEVETLVKKTWKPGVVGLGKNAINLDHSDIEVVGVRRLENPGLWEQYIERRQRFLHRLKEGTDRLQRLEEIHWSSGPVLTTSNIPTGSTLQREVASKVNEHYLFHGTKEEFLVQVQRDGLDYRFAKETAMLGRGIYAAECPTKSDQYTDTFPEQRTRGEKTMLLVRMLLGDPHVNTESDPPKFSRPPCKGCLEVVCDCPNMTHYDSVVDDAGRLFREFVVYEQCQCYPEYIITYTRV